MTAVDSVTSGGGELVSDPNAVGEGSDSARQRADGDDGGAEAWA